MRRNARLATLLLVLLLTSCALYRPEKFVLEAIPPAITAFALEFGYLGKGVEKEKSFCYSVSRKANKIAKGHSQ